MNAFTTINLRGNEFECEIIPDEIETAFAKFETINDVLWSS